MMAKTIDSAICTIFTSWVWVFILSFILFASGGADGYRSRGPEGRFGFTSGWNLSQPHYVHTDYKLLNSVFSVSLYIKNLFFLLGNFFIPAISWYFCKIPEQVSQKRKIPCLHFKFANRGLRLFGAEASKRITAAVPGIISTPFHSLAGAGIMWSTAVPGIISTPFHSTRRNNYSKRTSCSRYHFDTISQPCCVR